MSQTNKTPFEIRTELLHIAKDYLDKQYEVHLELCRAAHMELIKSSIVAQNELEKVLPQLYDFSKIEELATKLNSFVQFGNAPKKAE